jgi:hypothetical protein
MDTLMRRMIGSAPVAAVSPEQTKSTPYEGKYVQSGSGGWLLLPAISVAIGCRGQGNFTRYDPKGGKMNIDLNRSIKISFIIFACVLLTACGTSKTFVIDSNPKGALIIQHDKPVIEESFFWNVTYRGETPTQGDARFIGSIDTYYFTAEKRGYSPSIQKVTKESDLATITFNMSRIEGVPIETFKKENLFSGKFVLLPADTEVIIHSGIGRLDKKEYSPEISKKVTEDFNGALTGAFNNSQSKQVLVSSDSLKKDWEALSGELRTYLLKLNYKRLNYYSLPPYINAKLAAFKAFSEGAKGQTGSDPSYLLYIWARCISETKSRKIGNIVVGAASTAMAFSNPGFPYDPSAFNPNSGTMVVIYIIDANTSEVLYIEPRDFGYDITDPDDLKKVADFLSRFPNIDKKK